MFLVFDFQNTSATSPAKGNEADRQIDADVDQHPKLHDAWQPHAVSLDDDRAGHQRGHEIAGPRDQPDQRVPPEPEAGAGHPKRLIEQAPQRPQRCQPPLDSGSGTRRHCRHRTHLSGRDRGPSGAT